MEKTLFEQLQQLMPARWAPVIAWGAAQNLAKATDIDVWLLTGSPFGIFAQGPPSEMPVEEMRKVLLEKVPGFVVKDSAFGYPADAFVVLGEFTLAGKTVQVIASSAGTTADLLGRFDITSHRIGVELLTGETVVGCGYRSPDWFAPQALAEDEQTPERLVKLGIRYGWVKKGLDKVA